MRDVEKDRSDLISAGWRRGSVIDLTEHFDTLNDIASGELARIINNTGNPPVIAICITYDCALVDGDFEREPWCHVLIAWPIDNPEKQFRDCRSLRKIHFDVTIGEKKVAYECTAISCDKFHRSLLKEINKAENLSIDDSTTFQLIKWAADRISKPTFPDSWERRFGKVWSRLKKTWKKHWFTNAIPAIYVKLSNWGELKEDQKYYASILVVHNLVGREAKVFLSEYADTITQKSSDAFRSTDKIELEDIHIMSESQVTLSMLRDYRRIHLDEFTYQVDGAPLPSSL